MKIAKVTIKMLDEILGSQPSNEEIYRKFIASKAPDAESVEDEVPKLGADEVAEKGKTIFLKNEDGTPLLLSHQVRGFFKNAWRKCSKVPKTKSSAVKAGVSKIDGLVFVDAEDGSKFIPFKNYTVTTDCERPLRADTAQGPRVSLACSERLEAGAEATFVVRIMDDSLEPVVQEWLAYGQFSGLGQWRNSGRGKFEVISYEVTTEDINEVLKLKNVS